MAEHRVIVTHKSIRRWCQKFEQVYANALRRRPWPDDKWHLDEVFVLLNGKTHYLWCAVAQDGQALDIPVRTRRDEAAAQFLRKLLMNLESGPACPPPISSSVTARRGRKRC